MEDYSKLLDEAYSEVKTAVGNGERFEIPKIEGRYQGKKTILTNFSQVVSVLRRNPEEFQRYLLKELAASGGLKGDSLVVNKRITREEVDRKIEQYAKEYVLCKECGKPDTEIVKEPGSRIRALHCLACGAKHPVH